MLLLYGNVYFFWRSLQVPLLQYWIDEPNLMEIMNGMKISLEFGLIGKLSLFSLNLSIIFSFAMASGRLSLCGTKYQFSQTAFKLNRSLVYGPFKSLVNLKRQLIVVGKKSLNDNNASAYIQKPRNSDA